MSKAVLRQVHAQVSDVVAGQVQLTFESTAFGAFMKSETQRWARVIEEANIKVE